MTTRPGLTLTKRYSPALLVRASSVVPGTTTRASSSGRCDVLSVTLPAIDPVWALSATNGTASKANDESITRRTATRAIAFIAYSIVGWERVDTGRSRHRLRHSIREIPDLCP